MRQFFQGMMYCFRGCSYLTTKGLKRLILLPLVFNFIRASHAGLATVLAAFFKLDVFNFIFNAWILSVQYQDFAVDNNLMGFTAMRSYLKKNTQSSLGFGTVINLASAIPVLNLVIMPSAVIGGVIMYCEQQNLKLLPKK